MPVRLDRHSNQLVVEFTGKLASALRQVCDSLLDFSGNKASSTHYWPRWLFFRFLAVAFIGMFSNFCVEGTAFLGPKGMTPVHSMLQDLVGSANPSLGILERVFAYPSLLWLSASKNMILGLSFGGLAAAIALLLNLWPRFSIFICWLFFLSLAASLGAGPQFILDRALAEVGFLAIFFAPRGFRPGLGKDSPPWSFSLFALRYFAFRIMFEAGVSKFKAGGDPGWRDFTAMDSMYLTTPLPTVLAYYLHNLPHWWHVGEVLLTILGEIVGPVAALFGRWPRFFAVLVWVFFQFGIEFTSNFGCLNIMAIGIGVVLLDDQTMAQAARKLGLNRVAGFLLAKAALSSPRGPSAGWSRRLAVLPLGLNVYLGSILLLPYLGIPPKLIPEALLAPGETLVSFYLAQEYDLYARLPSRDRVQIEIEGSDDGGKTWRAYPFKHQTQRQDQMSGLVSPYFARFECSLRMMSWQQGNAGGLTTLGTRLIEGDSDAVKLFAANPFPDHPPQKIVFPLYRMEFTDLATFRQTGHYWKRSYVRDFLPPLRYDPVGRVVRIDE